MNYILRQTILNSVIHGTRYRNTPIIDRAAISVCSQEMAAMSVTYIKNLPTLHTFSSSGCPRMFQRPPLKSILRPPPESSKQEEPQPLQHHPPPTSHATSPTTRVHARSSSTHLPLISHTYPPPRVPQSLPARSRSPARHYGPPPADDLISSRSESPPISSRLSPIAITM